MQSHNDTTEVRSQPRLQLLDLLENADINTAISKGVKLPLMKLSKETRDLEKTKSVKLAFAVPSCETFLGDVYTPLETKFRRAVRNISRLENPRAYRADMYTVVSLSCDCDLARVSDIYSDDYLVAEEVTACSELMFHYRTMRKIAQYIAASTITSLHLFNLWMDDFNARIVGDTLRNAPHVTDLTFQNTEYVQDKALEDEHIYLTNSCSNILRLTLLDIKLDRVWNRIQSPLTYLRVATQLTTLRLINCGLHTSEAVSLLTPSSEHNIKTLTQLHTLDFTDNMIHTVEDQPDLSPGLRSLLAHHPNLAELILFDNCFLIQQVTLLHNTFQGNTRFIMVV